MIPSRSATIGVVVPVFDGAATLARCLAAIRRSTVPIVTLVVVDDGSTDESAAIASREGAKVCRIDAGPLGPAAARNRGVAILDTDLVVFVDADVVVHPDAIARLTAAFDDGGVQAAFGSYDDRPAGRRLPALYANLRHHVVHQQGATEAGTFWAGLGAVRRATFITAGRFDERYRTASIEDVEFGLRLRAAGHRIQLVPSAQGCHLKDWTLGQLWRTDVLRRAVPWSRLIAEGRAGGNDLNLRMSEKVSAALVLLTACLVVVQPVAAGVTLLAWMILNRTLFGLLWQHGVRAALAGVALHAVYLMYSSATFVVVSLHHRIAGRRRT